MHVIRSVGYSAIWYLVQVALRYKDNKYFSCTFPFFEKAKNLFNASGHHAYSPIPTKISIDILLPATKHLAQNYRSLLHKMISIFTVGGWRMCPFNLPLLAPAYIPTQSCKRYSF